MQDRFIDEDVRTRLILSGLSELEAHGARDFSLRRAAEAAGVSCAAPYRYFKSKEDYISEIISYLSSKWELMLSEISKALASEPLLLIAELCVANIRFWLSNSNLASVLTLPGVSISDFDILLSERLASYFSKQGRTEREASQRISSVRALILGYVTLIASGELPNNADTIDSARMAIINGFLK